MGELILHPVSSGHAGGVGASELEGGGHAFAPYKRRAHDLYQVRDDLIYTSIHTHVYLCVVVYIYVYIDGLIPGAR